MFIKFEICNVFSSPEDVFKSKVETFFQEFERGIIVLKSFLESESFIEYLNFLFLCKIKSYMYIWIDIVAVY